jgi:hypothetical protein
LRKSDCVPSSLLSHMIRMYDALSCVLSRENITVDQCNGSSNYQAHSLFNYSTLFAFPESVLLFPIVCMCVVVFDSLLIVGVFVSELISLPSLTRYAAIATAVAVFSSLVLGSVYFLRAHSESISDGLSSWNVRTQFVVVGKLPPHAPLYVISCISCCSPASTQLYCARK